MSHVLAHALPLVPGLLGVGPHPGRPGHVADLGQHPRGDPPAASTGSASCRASRTTDATAGVTVVSGVGSRNSSRRLSAARARSPAQGSTGGGEPRAWPVSTVAWDRMVRLWCGSLMSNTLTNVPQ